MNNNEIVYFIKYEQYANLKIIARLSKLPKAMLAFRGASASCETTKEKMFRNIDHIKNQRPAK